MSPKPGTDHSWNDLERWVDKVGFLKLPNPLFDKLISSDLISVKGKILLLCLRWSVGFRKTTCTASLRAGLSKKLGQSPKYLSKVLKQLIQDGYLVQVQPPGFKKPALYTIPFLTFPLQEDSPTAVGLLESDGESKNDPSQSHSSGTPVPTEIGLTVPLQGDSQSHPSGNLHRHLSIENDFIDTGSHRAPLKGPSGTIADCAENAQPAARLWYAKTEEKDSEAPAALGEKRADREKQKHELPSAEEWAALLVEIFDDIWKTKVHDNLPAKDLDPLVTVVGRCKGQTARQEMLNEWTRACRIAKEQGLPPKVNDIERFGYLWRNRDAYSRNGGRP